MLPQRGTVFSNDWNPLRLYVSKTQVIPYPPYYEYIFYCHESQFQLDEAFFKKNH